MGLIAKIRNVVRGVLQAYGTPKIKSALWNTEFASGRWECLERTPGDCVYPWVEKYAAQGSILDLGCGSGSTAVELAFGSYRGYTGVDISDVAIAKAVRRSQEAGRAQKNHFDKSDFSNYIPVGPYNVILFRDSIYYVPLRKIKTMLDGYSGHLVAEGVFIVRLSGGGNEKDGPIVKIFENNFKIVEKYLHNDPQALIIIFRPEESAGPRGGRSPF